MGMAKEAKTHTGVLTFEYVFVYLLYLFFTVYCLLLLIISSIYSHFFHLSTFICISFKILRRLHWFVSPSRPRCFNSEGKTQLEGHTSPKATKNSEYIFDPPKILSSTLFNKLMFFITKHQVTLCSSVYLYIYISIVNIKYSRLYKKGGKVIIISFRYSVVVAATLDSLI